MLSVAVVLALLTTACGSEEPAETLPPEPAAVLDAAAVAMGEIDYVTFKIEWTGGAPISIEGLNADFEVAEGQFASPDAANAVATLGVSNVKAQVGVITIKGQSWLTEPITGIWVDAPSAYNFDPATLFDPELGWQALIANGLTDVEWVAEEERGSEPRYHIRATADEDRVAAILAGLIPKQSVVLDMWIDPVTGHIREAELSTVYQGQSSDWLIEFTKYGEPVEIEPPDTES